MLEPFYRVHSTSAIKTFRESHLSFPPWWDINRSQHHRMNAIAAVLLGRKAKVEELHVLPDMQRIPTSVAVGGLCPMMG